MILSIGEQSAIRADDVNKVHMAGLDLWVRTVNGASRIQELLEMGIDGITTDNPAMERQLLEQSDGVTIQSKMNPT